MEERKYIRVKIEGLVGGDQWVFKAGNENGVLVNQREGASLFNETEAFEVRKKITEQVPNKVNVTFDL